MTYCWRTGRKVGRTIYLQQGADPSDDDPLIGVMDTNELARIVVDAVNGAARHDAVEVVGDAGGGDHGMSPS